MVAHAHNPPAPDDALHAFEVVLPEMGAVAILGGAKLTYGILSAQLVCEFDGADRWEWVAEISIRLHDGKTAIFRAQRLDAIGALRKAQIAALAGVGLMAAPLTCARLLLRGDRECRVCDGNRGMFGPSEKGRRGDWIPCPECDGTGRTKNNGGA